MGHHRGMTEQVTATRAPSRLRQTGLDMIRSLGLVSLLMLGVLWLVHPRTPDAVREVDWRPVAQSAAEVAGYEVLAPAASLSWPATSARVEEQADGTLVWRAGYVTPGGRYAGLLQRGAFPEQAARARQEWIDAESRDGRPEGTVTLGGRQWTRLVGERSPDDRRSLLVVDAGTATLVTGSASWDELEALAAGLRTVPAG